MLRSGNPTLKASSFANIARPTSMANAMTIQGTVNKTGIMLLLLFASAAFVWQKLLTQGPEATLPWMYGGAIGGLIFALITIFVKKAAPFTAPIYAILEGLFLGGISSLMEMQFPGIVIQATGLTFFTLFGLLTAYKSGWIKVTEKFRLGLFAATGAIFLVYMVSWILGFFGTTIPYIHQSGMVGIGFSLFVVVIAALNLVLDFDIIERGAKEGAPKFMEWYGAFALMVTLIWLYIEILVLLAKLRGRK